MTCDRKVSKSDLRRELEHPEKHNWAFDDIDAYWLACPEEVVDMDLIPKKWGVVVVSEGKLVVRRKPVALHDDKGHSATLNRKFAISVIRAMAKSESRKAFAELEVEKQRKDSFDSGYRAAMNEISKGELDVNKVDWMWRFCRSLGVYNEKDAKNKAERISELEPLGWRLEWLRDAAESVCSHATNLRKFIDGKIAEAKRREAEGKADADATPEETA